MGPARVVRTESESRVRSAGARRIWIPLAPIMLLGLASPALASGGVAQATHHAGASGWVSLIVILGAGLGLRGWSHSPRRGAVASLALLVALLGVETAVHSVHHGLDAQAAALCAVLAACQHESGAAPVVADVGAPDWSGAPAHFTERERPPAFRPSRPHDGRAPPISPSV